MPAVIHIDISAASNVAGAPAAAGAKPQLHSPTCCACSHFYSRLQLCRVRYYCIPACIYSSLTIRVSRRERYLVTLHCLPLAGVSTQVHGRQVPAGN